MSADRERISVVGTALRQAIETANSAKLTTRQHRTLLAVIHVTASWTKLDDQLYLGELARLAWGVEWAEPWQLKKTSADLRCLEDAGIIEKDAPKGRPWNDDGPRYRVALPRPVTDPDSGSSDTDKATQDQVLSRPGIGSLVAPESDTPPRISPRISPEEETTLEAAFIAKLADAESAGARGITPQEIRQKAAGLEATYGEDGALARLRGIRGPYDWPRDIVAACKRWKPGPEDQATDLVRTWVRLIQNNGYELRDAKAQFADQWGADSPLYRLALDQLNDQLGAAA